MFKNLFNPESGLMITMSWVTDCIFLSLFWIVTSFPLVTIGASSAALYDAFVTLDVYVYNSLFNSTIPTYGYASAAGFMQSVFGCVTLVTANAIVSKFDKESAFF